MAVFFWACPLALIPFIAFTGEQDTLWYFYKNDEGSIFSVYSEQMSQRDHSLFVQSQRWTKENGKLLQESVGSSADLNTLLPKFFNTRLTTGKGETITDAVFREIQGGKKKIFEISLKTKKNNTKGIPIGEPEHLKKSVEVDFILASHFPQWLNQKQEGKNPKRTKSTNFLVETQEVDGFPIRKATGSLQKCDTICEKIQGTLWKITLSETPQPIAESFWYLEKGGAVHQVQFPKSNITMVKTTEKLAKEWIEKNSL